MLKKLFGPSKPKWEVVQSNMVPGWVQKQIDRIYGTSPEADLGQLLIYRIKGKRFRYKMEFEVRAGSGWYSNQRVWGNVRVYRKPRMWYWKKLNN